MSLILVFLAIFYISIDRIYGEGRTQILPSSSASIGPLPKISIDGLYWSLTKDLDQDPDEAVKAFILYEYLQKRKRWNPINYFLYGVFDHGWYQFQLKYWWLFLVLVKFRWQVLLQGIFDGTNTVIYHVLSHEKSAQKSSVSRFAL